MDAGELVLGSAGLPSGSLSSFGRNDVLAAGVFFEAEIFSGQESPFLIEAFSRLETVELHTWRFLRAALVSRG